VSATELPYVLHFYAFLICLLRAFLLPLAAKPLKNVFKATLFLAAGGFVYIMNSRLYRIKLDESERFPMGL
jgi:hypothetical protein